MKRAHSFSATFPSVSPAGERADASARVRKVPELTTAQSEFHTGTRKSAAFSVSAALDLYAKAKSAK